MSRAPAAALLLLAACGGQVVASDGADIPVVQGTLDKARARARYATTADVMRYIVAPGCAAERNECHNSEDFPDLSTMGNLWNLVGLACNQGLGERSEVEDFCERPGDQLRIEDGANAGFSAEIGSITSVVDEAGQFQHIEVRLAWPVEAAQQGGRFVIVRGGAALAALGGGSSLEVAAGETILRITDAGDLPDPGAVRQGDENQNGTFGSDHGVQVAPGRARDSYLIRRLLGAGASRPRMPLEANADTVNETNPFLTRDQMYALMSWINCMEPGDGPADPIRYDCAANADNEGTW